MPGTARLAARRGLPDRGNLTGHNNHVRLPREGKSREVPSPAVSSTKRTMRSASVRAARANRLGLPRLRAPRVAVTERVTQSRITVIIGEPAGQPRIASVPRELNAQRELDDQMAARREKGQPLRALSKVPNGGKNRQQCAKVPPGREGQPAAPLGEIRGASVCHIEIRPRRRVPARRRSGRLSSGQLASVAFSSLLA